MRRCAILLCLLLLSCGSAPGPAPIPTDNAGTLCWEQKPFRADNVTPANLRVDLSYFEVNASLDNQWGDNTIVAIVAGIDNAGDPIRSIPLAVLASTGIIPYPDGCFLTVRNVSSDNVPSAYGTPCWWGGWR